MGKTCHWTNPRIFKNLWERPRDFFHICSRTTSVPPTMIDIIIPQFRETPWPITLKRWSWSHKLGGGFKHCYFHPNFGEFGEMIQIHLRIFFKLLGWNTTLQQESKPKTSQPRPTSNPGACLRRLDAQWSGLWWGLHPFDHQVTSWKKGPWLFRVYI